MAERGFQPGNKLGGRKAGSKNKALMLIEQIGIDNAQEITQKVIDMALSGDLSAAKMILDRIWPIPRQETYIETAFLEDVCTQADVNRVMTDILNEVGDGALSLEDATQVIHLIEKKSQSIHPCMQEELEAMRAQLEQVKKAA